MRRLPVVSLLLLVAAGAPVGQTVVVERQLESMVAVPSGMFVMGATQAQQETAAQLCREEIGPRVAPNCRPEAFLIEGPSKMVFVSAFQIDRVEVTVAAYQRCVRAGACAPEPLLEPDRRLLAEALPITSVTWNEAVRYCAWRGARLPTEAEWERAARGQDGRMWPWGKAPRPAASNHGRFFIVGELGPAPQPVVQPDSTDGFALLAPVGSFPDGASAAGVLDLAGNAAEWTADAFDEAPPQQRGVVNPRGPQLGSQRAVRGGSWRQPQVYQRVTARDLAPVDTRSPEIGFRCVR